MRGRLCLRKKWSNSKGLLLYIFKIGKNDSTFVFPMEMSHQVEGGREGEGEKGRGRGEDPQVGCGPRKGKQARQRKTPLWAFDGRDFPSSTSGGGGIGVDLQPAFHSVCGPGNARLDSYYCPVTVSNTAPELCFSNGNLCSPLFCVNSSNNSLPSTGPN